MYVLLRISPHNDPCQMSLPHNALLFNRCWCPDRTLAQARKYITESMGGVYAEGVILDLQKMWEESDIRTPLICFLSMGSDPTNNIEGLAKKLKLECSSISMGQGQEVHARRLLQQSITLVSDHSAPCNYLHVFLVAFPCSEYFNMQGGWVLLQNCHLGLNFLDELLDTITETENVHDSCRVWITTEVHPKFPISLLQVCDQTSIHFK